MAPESRGARGDVCVIGQISIVCKGEKEEISSTGGGECERERWGLSERRPF